MRWFRWGDMIPAGVVLLTAVVMAVLWMTAPQGAFVNVQTPDGTHRLSLNENSRLPLESNGYHLTIVVQDGRVFVEDTTCPDRVCCQTGAVSRTSESIVCVPAAVIVTVEGTADEAAPDAVAR